MTEILDPTTGLQPLKEPPSGLIVEGNTDLKIRLAPFSGRVLIVPFLVLIALAFVVTANPVALLAIVFVISILVIHSLTSSQLTLTPQSIEYRVGIGVFGIRQTFSRDEIIGVVFDEGGPPEGKNTRRPHLMITQTGKKGLRFNRILSGIRKDHAEWIVEAVRLKMGDWQGGHAAHLQPVRGEHRPDAPTSDP